MGGGGGVDQKIIFDLKGEGGVWTPLKIDHEIYEQPLTLQCISICT